MADITPPAGQASNATDAATQVVAPQLTDDPAVLKKQIAELEERNAAYRKGVDQNAAEKKRQEAEIARLKVLAGEKETVVAPNPEDGKAPVTREEFNKTLSRRDFETANATGLKLLNEEQRKAYNQVAENGGDLQAALDLGLFRSGVTPSQKPSVTQQGVSAPAHGVDRGGGDLMGVPEELIAAYKRSKDFKDWKDEDIAKTIVDARARKQQREGGPAW